jgi:EAL domain-containing protein (putative c-di-GMP-specific phosphodiesterase class I)
MNVSFVVPNVHRYTTITQLKEMNIHHFQGDALCPYTSADEVDKWLSQYSAPYLKDS